MAPRHVLTGGGLPALGALCPPQETLAGAAASPRLPRATALSWRAGERAETDAQLWLLCPSLRSFSPVPGSWQGGRAEPAWKRDGSGFLTPLSHSTPSRLSPSPP